MRWINWINDRDIKHTRRVSSLLSFSGAMPLCNEREALHVEMPEAEAERDKSVLILINHCKEMRRQERNSRIVTGLLLLGVAALFIFFQTRKDSSSDREHAAKYEDPIAYQPGANPSAHLTAPSQYPCKSDYLAWEAKNGEAHLHNFVYANNSLIVSQAGRYHVYLQITYRMIESKACKPGSMLLLHQAVYRKSESYPKDITIMETSDSVNCNEHKWWKSVFSSAVFLLEKDDQLKVKAEHPDMIHWQETNVFFGAYLI
ncbi:lymphotoxin-alpha-like [Megalops cyprinoides]|uniref:lymphotoxin-alpha-like n=1 Tax=Megalops cyprinoides TaxID=118141 RepID=UPI001863E006|nr:lymphotoxin-alpha-like [Megalops cyprinoides]